MLKKNSKNIKKKEELPSFLLNLSNHHLDRKFILEEKPLLLPPIFFGECMQFHGFTHPVVLSGLPYRQYSKTSYESIAPKLFLSKEKLADKPFKPEKIRLKKKRRKEFIDQYSYRCRGMRKVFVPEINVFTPDLGETSSEIENDTWREIPFCRVKSNLVESAEQEVENFTLSDMKEKNRALLPYEQRMAHYHFPKEFVTVKLVGPVIPASITIKKIPSKRKRMSDFAFESEEKADTEKSVLKSAAKKEIIKTTEGGEKVKTEVMVTKEETEVEDTEMEDKSGEVEGSDENVEEREEPNEENVEETEKMYEEKEGDGRLGTEAPSAGEIIVEGEEEAEMADEGENIEDAKEV